MKANMLTEILDLEDKPIEVDKAVLTLRKVCVMSLLAGLPGDDKMDGEKKLALYHLASVCQTTDAPDFKTEQIVLIKERVLTAYGTLVYGRVDELMEKNDAVTTAKDKYQATEIVTREVIEPPAP